MEYKDKTRKYRVITPYLILLFFILTIPEISKAQTDQEYLQGLIDNAKVNQQLDIDLRGKTYTVSSLTISNDNGDKSHYKTILLTNGRIVQSKGKNNGSLIMIKDNSTLLLRNITISGSGDEAKNSLIYIDEGNGSAGLCIYEGTIIEKGFVSNDVYASCIRVGTGSLFIEGGEIHGNKGIYGEVCIDSGSRVHIWGGSVGTVYDFNESDKIFNNIYIGDDALIRECLYLCGSKSKLILSSALKNDLTVSKSGEVGTIIATSDSSYSDYVPTWDDVAKFHDYSGKHSFALRDGNIVFADEGESEHPIETEDDLSGKIDELPAGTEETPSEVVIEQEVSLTKPVDVNDKYIGLGGGGTLVSQNSDAGIIVNKGGLALSDIVIRGEWTNASTLLNVKNSGYLKIGWATQIVSMSDYLRTVLIDKLSSVVSEGTITGHISNSGSLFVKDGAITGQISSFSPFKLSGKVPVKNGIYLGEGQTVKGLINLVDPLQYTLNVLVDENMVAGAVSSVLVAQGTDGYMPTESDLNKLVCFTDDCEFFLHGYQILMRKIDHTANEKIDRASLQLRTNGREIHVEGVPVGQPYGLYDLAGVLLSGGVSNGGTISLSVNRPGIYIFHISGIGKKIQISK